MTLPSVQQDTVSNKENAPLTHPGWTCPQDVGLKRKHTCHDASLLCTRPHSGAGGSQVSAGAWGALGMGGSVEGLGGEVLPCILTRWWPRDSAGIRTFT